MPCNAPANRTGGPERSNKSSEMEGPGGCGVRKGVRLVGCGCDTGVEGGCGVMSERSVMVSV